MVAMDAASQGVNTCSRCGVPQPDACCVGVVHGDGGPMGPLLVFCDKCFKVKCDSFVSLRSNVAKLRARPRA